jgi:drug/metabolite transporter (DMT)-like permease
MSSAQTRNNLIGIASLAAGVFIFSTQDAIIKSISGDHAVTLAIAIRGIVSLPFLLLIVRLECGLREIFGNRTSFLVLRGAIMLLAYTSYYMAFPALPLAEAIALFFMAPILITIMSGPLLKEHITIGSWIAVVLGFAGVLVILQPGSDLFRPAALLSLISAATYGFAMVMARKHGGEIAASVMAFYQNLVYLVGAIIVGAAMTIVQPELSGLPSLDFLLRGWAWPGWHDFLMMAACGVIAAVAMSLLTHAYRIGNANLVTPFEYTGMIWGSLWGFLFFQEVPRITTFAGMAMIAAAGILSVRANARQKETPHPSRSPVSG